MPNVELVHRTSRAGKAKVSLTADGLQRLEELASGGNDQRTIASELGLAWSTFRDLRDRDESVQEALARGLGGLANELTHHLLKAARKGNVTAAIYLTKARLGWVEGQSPDGFVKPAVQVNIQIPRAMTDAEFRRLVSPSPGTGEGSNGPPPLIDGATG